MRKERTIRICGRHVVGNSSCCFPGGGGEWASLLACGQECTSRGARACSQTQLGPRLWFKWENCHLALQGAAVAPGNEETQAALQNHERRLPCLRNPIPPDILNAAPVEPLVVDAEDFARNVRGAKRGAAGEEGEGAVWHDSRSSPLDLGVRA